MEITFQGQTYKYYTPDSIPWEELPELVIRKSKGWRDKYTHFALSFDIETSTIDKHHAIMYMWSMDIQGISIIGRTWEDAVETFRKIALHYDLVGNDIKMLCWIHNFPFEWSFARKWIPWAKDKKGFYNVFATSERKIIYALSTWGIEFRDSLILTARPLKALPEAYGFKDRIHKMTEDTQFDYKKIRTPETPLEDSEIVYSIVDSRILSIWHDIYINKQFLRNNIKIPLTSTGLVRADLKRSFDSMPKDKREYYKKRIRDSFPTKELYGSMVSYLYRGGFVHGNRLYADTTLTNLDISSYDFTSSYPAVMLHSPMPWKYVVKPSGWFFKYVYPHYNGRYMKDRCFFGCFKFTNIRARNTHSIESISKLYNYKNVREDNGRLISADSITVLLDDNDWKSYIDFYAFDRVECISLYVSLLEPLPEYLKDIVLEYYYKKSILEKDNPERNIAKAKLNSTYGMCVTSLYNLTYKLKEDGNIHLVESDFDYDKAISKQILLVQWGIRITSQARRNLLETMKKCEDSIAYCDTDSLKMIHSTGCKWAIDCYNDRMQRLNDTMYVGNYPREIFSGLGKFDYEGKWFKLSVLGAKRYIHTEVHKDKKTGKYHLVDEVTIAGLPKKALIEYAESKQKSVYELFEFGLKVDVEYSMKLCAGYNDEEFSQVVTDYLGNSTECYEKSCVALSDTTFKMDGTKEYIAILTAIINQRKDKYGYNKVH